MTLPDEPQPTYTLDEAEQLLKERQCASSQHHLVPVGGTPSRLRCASCERTFDLVPVEVPDVPS